MSRRITPSWLSPGTSGCCDLWFESSPSQSFVGGSLPTEKQALAPNDDKWNPLQTKKKENTYKSKI